MKGKIKTQKGFIQIPILIIAIIVVAASAVGVGVILHKQSKSVPLVSNLAQVFNRKDTGNISFFEESEKGNLEQEELEKEQSIKEENQPEGIQETETQLESREGITPESQSEPQSSKQKDIEPKEKSDPCADMNCPNCQYCLDGNCIAHSDGYNDCGSGCQRCVNGSCRDDNFACSNCQHCSSDACVNYCQGTDNSCGCTNCINCNNSDAWVNVDSSYTCCDGNKACFCQKQEYRDYFCSGTSCNYSVTNTRINKINCTECEPFESCLNGTCQSNCAGTDTSCGSTDCINCNDSDGCSGNSYLDYYCSDTSCVYTSDNCSDCSCSCGDYNVEESIANGNCSDGKDNDCDGDVDSADSGCIFQQEFTVLNSPLGGNITQNSKLTLENSPYVVTQTIQVLEGVTLEIEPGVTLKFDENTAIRIEGELIAKGTHEQKIIFTSNQDNPRARNWIGDTDARDWNGINFLGKSKDTIIDNDNYISGNIIKYSIIQYAFTGLSLGEQLDPLKVFVGNNIIRDNYKGISVSGDSVIVNNIIDNNSETGIEILGGNPILSQNEITNNTIRAADLPDFDRWDFAAVKIWSGGASVSKNIIKENARGFSFWFSANPIIQYNNIYNNEGRNFKLAQKGDIQAPHNYWGTTKVSEIDATILDYYDNIGLGKVNYQPIATSEIPDAGAH